MSQEEPGMARGSQGGVGEARGERCPASAPQHPPTWVQSFEWHSVTALGPGVILVSLGCHTGLIWVHWKAQMVCFRALRDQSPQATSPDVEA